MVFNVGIFFSSYALEVRCAYFAPAYASLNVESENSLNVALYTVQHKPSPLIYGFKQALKKEKTRKIKTLQQL